MWAGAGRGVAPKFDILDLGSPSWPPNPAGSLLHQGFSFHYKVKPQLSRDVLLKPVF